jgi:hypothetical protein
LSPITAIAFSVVLLKFGLILAAREWYQTTQIQNVAFLETCRPTILSHYSGLSTANASFHNSLGAVWDLVYCTALLIAFSWMHSLAELD